MFDDALEDLIREGNFYEPTIEKPVSKKNMEVESVIGGAAVVPAAPREEVHLEAHNVVPEEHQFLPLQHAPEPAQRGKAENQIFPGPLQLAAPIQVHLDSPEPGVSPKLNTNHERSKPRTQISGIKQEIEHLGYR